MGKFVISVRQFMVILILYGVGTSILNIPASITGEAKQDAWISSILGVVISLLIIKLYITVGNLAPNLSLVEIYEQILGKWIGKLVSLTFIIVTLLAAGELVFYVSNFMRTEIIPETPAYAINILFVLVIVYATYLGIETFARSAEILFPFFVLLFIIFVVLISPQIDFHNVQPVLEVGAKPLISSTFIFISGFSLPLFVLLMLFPSIINENKDSGKAFYLGTIIAGIILIIVIALPILVLGAETTSQRTFPSYALAQRISIGNFLERIEVIMGFMWIITIFIRTIMYFYASVIGLTQILKLQDYRSIVLPLGMILVVLSLIVHPNIIHSNLYDKEIWPILALIHGLFLPLLLIVVAKVRNSFKPK
ncbi:GerAB/ArcD/ProY family transporter [Psychrobacillus vulpis]|uniref:Spore gernimation protein n=1 Tax=Psychrobacillus vulpis TaxID=2325572 RepID=A0A544TNI3_9BACI|nr:endospore germination permease [Psychrobacillus vulpis]TQR19008.1 spore gernimation protein [Psychrobacillus vulpis]